MVDSPDMEVQEARPAFPATVRGLCPQRLLLVWLFTVNPAAPWSHVLGSSGHPGEGPQLEVAPMLSWSSGLVWAFPLQVVLGVQPPKVRGGGTTGPAMRRGSL